LEAAGPVALVPAGLAGCSQPHPACLCEQGVEAERKGIALNIFKLEDYGIKYGYSPLLVAHPDTLR